MKNAPHRNTKLARSPTGCTKNLRTPATIAATNTGTHGRNAHRNTSTKYNGCPLVFLIGPVLKKRPNWLSHKKNLMPETFVCPNTTFSGCESNCRYSAITSGAVNSNDSANASNHFPLHSLFHCFWYIHMHTSPLVMVISVNTPLVITAPALNSAPSSRYLIFVCAS